MFELHLKDILIAIRKLRLYDVSEKMKICRTKKNAFLSFAFHKSFT